MLRRRSVAVFLSALLATAIVPIGRPEPVEAALPVAPLCQTGFLEAAAPRTDTTCENRTVDPQVAAALPSGFQESVVWSGLTNPTVIRFAADGRVFVAEKSGVIKIFDSLSDTTPTTFSGLTTAVQNFWDRGLLGMALDPSIAGGAGGTGSYVYVLYAYDHILGDSAHPAPKWGDQCPSQPNGPGPTTDGCVVSGRLSRFAVTGSTITGSEQILLEDWCQQFPSHSVGSLVFGPDGALYVSGGDGANFNAVDYGQFGGSTTPVFTGKNPCADPPNDAMTPPTAEGGSLRSQDVRTLGAGYRATVLADNPVAYWRLEESSGSALDSSGNGYSLTPVGTPTYRAAGIVNPTTDFAADFDGATNGFGGFAPAMALPAGASGRSIEAWFKTTDAQSNAQLFGYGTGTGAQDFTLGLRNGAILYADHAQSHTWGSGYNNGQPHHVVLTFDGTSMHCFVDGAEVSPSWVPGTPIATALHDVLIGVWINFLDATIDEVAVYNYALSAGQVAAHRAAGIAGGSGEPTGLDGAVLRIDPTSGAGMAGNPFASSADPNARRIIAFGLRNPFRIGFRPGTNELWVGDVGWNTWEELNRIPNATDATAENFGWPCYEGVGRQGGYDGTNLNLCESLYGGTGGPVANPYFTYNHSALVVAGETCPTGGSSITGVAFYPETGGSYPATYRGGVFFADHTRNCIWFMPKGTNGDPDPSAIQAFMPGAAHPVDLVIGPGGVLYYADFEGGAVRRVTFSSGNQPPTAVIAANPISGPAPLTVQFNGSGSTDPEGTALTYAWDLDGDGAYDDATGVTTSRTYSNPGDVTVGLQVTDAGSASGTDTQLISVGNSPPAPSIATPASGTTWRVGDTINFSGSATDPEDGALPAAALTWTASIVHCPSNCHTHPPFFTQAGVASGSFSAPDHDYPSQLQITLTATDTDGASTSVSRLIDAQGVTLTFQSVPAGLSLVVNGTASVTPFTRTVIIGSNVSVTATSPQVIGPSSYAFTSWSDGGAQSHQITAPATATTFTATYQASGISLTPTADAQIRSNQANKNFGSATTMRIRSGQSRAYLKFVVTGLSGPATNARLRLWVVDGGTNGGSIYRLTNTSWTETGITWNNAPTISGNPLASLGTVTTGTWVEFDLGSVITGNGTYTFAISGGNTDSVDYATRESTNDPVLILSP